MAQNPCKIVKNGQNEVELAKNSCIIVKNDRASFSQSRTCISQTTHLGADPSPGAEPSPPASPLYHPNSPSHYKM